jgi:chloride channel protein, CIC family
MSHQGFPVLDGTNTLLGVLTRWEILDPAVSPESLLRELVKQQPVVTHQDNTLREAADHMVRKGVGRLPVVEHSSGRLIGIISNSDLLAAHAVRLSAES